ncbi:hypothetical protein RCC89_19515 [Cytophagaceae bacterium ABcell3]|nr:hypothetical protein RCC89_19515 [Cytophagaceae bacterium ABcell3]
MIGNIYILGFLILFGCIGRKQMHKESRSEEVYIKIKSLVPSSWEVSKLDSAIILKSKDSVWFVPAVSPIRSMNEPENILQVFIEIQSKWSDKRMLETHQLNDSLSKILIRDYERIIDSLNIRKIDRDNFKKYPIEYIKRLNKWDKEKQALVDKIKRLPDISTKEYSVFISDNRPSYDDQVYPEVIAIEEQQIISKIAKDVFGQDSFKIAHPRY